MVATNTRPAPHGQRIRNGRELESHHSASPKQGWSRTLGRKRARKKKREQASFESLGLSKTMLAALRDAAYEYPTPVQAGLIPKALEGLDLVGQARTGTGKTAAFAIPIIEDLLPRQQCPGPQALILVPTRELAVQVHGEVEKLARGRTVRCGAVYGGKPLRAQTEKLKRGAEIVAGTNVSEKTRQARTSGAIIAVLRTSDRSRHFIGRWTVDAKFV
jgi:hypothetical protein